MYYEASTRGKPGPRKAAGCLHKVVDIKSRPRPISDLLQELIQREQWAQSLPEAQEMAEKWEVSVLSIIQVTLSTPDKFARPHLYVLNSSSKYLVQGAGYIEGNEDERTMAHKLRRQNIYLVWNEMKGLSYSDFEIFSEKVIREIGAQHTKTTSYSSDEGIDFFGKLKLREYLFTEDLSPTIQHQLEVWLIGQAKHYKAIKVSTPDIRELVGSVELARGRAFSVLGVGKYSELTIRVCDPIFILFFTTGDISSDGWNLLENSGVIGMDGLMLAAFLCDRQIGLVGNLFVKSKFNAWLGL